MYVYIYIYIYIYIVHDVCIAHPVCTVCDVHNVHIVHIGCIAYNLYIVYGVHAACIVSIVHTAILASLKEQVQNRTHAAKFRPVHSKLHCASFPFSINSRKEQQKQSRCIHICQYDRKRHSRTSQTCNPEQNDRPNPFVTSMVDPTG